MSRLFRSCCGRPQDDTHDISFSAETSIELLERLRAAANSSGSWLSRADRMLSELTAALAPSAHASLMGASSCAGSLVLLGCGAPGPGVPVSLGLSLPSPWHTHNDKVPRKLTWERCPVRQTGPRKPPLHQHSQSDRLPDSWLQLLPHDSKGQPALDPSAGALVPIIIGGRLAGALLVWEWESSPLVLTAPAKAASGLAQETATAEAASRVTAAVIRPGSLLEKDEKPRTSSARAASAEGLRLSGLPAGCSSLLRIPVALAAVVGVVRDCLLAPNLDEIRLVCAAAHELAHAPNIPTIATVLSTTVSSFLSATLHCDLSVRPALVPSPANSTSVQYGFLLQERLGATATGAAVGGLSHPASSLPQDLEDPYGGNGAGGRLTGLVTRTNSCGVLRSSALMRSRSFLLSCAEEASDGESSTALKSSAGLAFPYSGGRDGGAGVTGSPFEGVPRRTGNRWKAVPFALPTALLGELLRPGYHSSRASSTLTPRSSLPSGPVASSANAGSFKRLLSCPVNDPPTPLTRGNGGSCTTADGGGRLTAVVLPDLHQYLQDVHRLSGDVLLLFTSQRRTATNLSNSATANAASSSGSVSAPACLVLLATSAAATRTGGPGRAQSAVEDTSCGKRTSTHAGVGSSLPSMQPSQPPLRTPTGLEEPSYTPPRVALYVSSQDRLPGSLLTAARDASREVLQVLLPSTLLGLTRGTAAAELQEIAALMEARGQPGTAAVPAGPSRDVTAPGTTRSSAPIRPYRATGPQPRAPPSPTPQQPPPLFEHNPQQHSQNNTLDDDGSVTILHTPTRSAASVSVVCSPPAVLPLPCTTLSPISRINTGAGVTTSGGSATPSRWLLEALLRSGSSGGKKTRQRQQAYLSPHSRVCRNMSASDLLPAASAPPEIAPPPVAVAQALLTTTNSAAMPGLERSPRQNVGGRMSSAAVVGVSSGLVASRGELLDLECMTGRLGTDPLLPELPAMRLLLTSFFSTLNDTEADPSPHAADDLRCLRLTRVIGDGGCSIVYGGLLHGLDVAVKVLHPLQPMVTEEDVTGDLLGEGCSTSRPPGGGDGDVMVTAGLAGIGMGGGYEVPAARGQPMWAVARQARLRELMRGVRELAVMSAISHPNIVQVYSHHTQVRMVAAASPGGLPTLVPMATDDGHVMADADETHVVIIMERCDVGSLADALDSGLFERAVRQAAAAAERGDTPGRRAVSGAMRHPLAATTCASSGQGGGTSGSSHGGSGPVPTRHPSLTSFNSGGSRMRGIYLTLLEVALALRHLHSKNVAHCDVKAANVLLKSSPNDPRGFTCRLGDFGLVGVVRKEVGDGCEHPAGQEGPVGTVTHLAPEYYTPGTKLDSSVDVYAFGIVMWEVYTGKPPFNEFAATHFEDLPYKVVHERLRPRWPRGTPSPYRALASACWAADPATRPTAAVLVTSLQQLMESS